MSFTFDSSDRCNTLHSLTIYNATLMMSLTEKDVYIELPIQDSASHFRIFNTKFRDKESKEDAKSILCDLEKDQLLLDLIPIAFNEELEGELQTFSLFIEKENLSTSSGNLSLHCSNSLVNQNVLLNVNLWNSKG